MIDGHSPGIRQARFVYTRGAPHTYVCVLMIAFGIVRVKIKFLKQLTLSSFVSEFIGLELAGGPFGSISRPI